MLLLLLLFKARHNIKLRCFKIVIKKLYPVMPYKPDVARLSTIHSPPNSCTRYTWCLISLAIWGSCAGCMCYSASCLVCPLVCSLHYPVALYKLRVMWYSQLSCFPSYLSTPLSSCLLLGACFIIQPVDLFHSSAQHYVPTNVKLSPSTMLVVASCQTRREIHFKRTFAFKCTFYNKIKLDNHNFASAANVFNICCVMCQCFQEERRKNDHLNQQQIIFVMFRRKKWINVKLLLSLK